MAALMRSGAVPVVINGSKVGEVEIVGEPGDEIAEFFAVVGSLPRRRRRN